MIDLVHASPSVEQNKSNLNLHDSQTGTRLVAPAMYASHSLHQEIQTSHFHPVATVITLTPGPCGAEHNAALS